MKKFTTTLLLLFSLSLVGCSSTKEEVTTTEASVKETANDFKAAHEELRLAFNQVQLGQEANEFAGGSSLSQLEGLFGTPNKHETLKAGDVDLDAYTWTADSVTISAQLYKDSAVAASISNFAFNRQPSISLEKYQGLSQGMTYTQVTDKLGEPDVVSKSVSTGRQDIQAIWVSGLYTNSGGKIELTFEQNGLTTMTQVGLISNEAVTTTK
ncbi:DUF3862 domain-containing protein [Streptococcus caprae]|uniref:DUF3862 domain-containing protein n=1 Tax=Streptococcus caprae TaxID=1640501 RepID=A0ABV8CT05_9STRE